jgi:hypothetical protein
MECVIDIETVPSADKTPFLDEAKASFKAPSSLTKDQAGADLNLTKDEIKFTGKAELIARWESEMAEQKAPEMADDLWRKTSFDGGRGRVVSIGWKVGDSEGVAFGDPDNDTATIREAFSSIKALCNGRPPFFIGHRVVFDLKFLFRRCVVLNLQPSFPLPFWGRNQNHYFCTMESWCEHGEKISMDSLAKCLGMEGKGDIDGSMVCDLWLAGKYQTIADYNLSDVRKTAEIHKRMTFA